MTVKGFKTWLEFKDIFGFDQNNKDAEKSHQNDMPIKSFDLEKLFSILASKKIGTNEGRSNFMNEVQWGDNSGSIKCWCGTGLNLMIDRLGSDLTGNPTWYTKRIFQINRGGYGGYEDIVANEVLDEVQVINKEDIDSPKREYNKLDSIVVQMDDSKRRNAKNIFIYEGIKKISNSNYIIRLGVKGHGNQAPDHQRVEENQTSIIFEKEKGMIRILNYNIESGMGQHEWAMSPSDTDLNFFPTQENSEIIETITNTLKWY